MSRLDDLERLREVLFLALDGDRLLQGAVKDGEVMSFKEPAASIARALQPVLRELDELSGGDAVEVPTVDEIAARRSARISDSDDSALPSRRSQSRRRGRSDRTG